MPTAVEVAAMLPRDTVWTLGLLADTDDDVAELTLGTLPLGSRITLKACGAVEQNPDSSEIDFRLLPFGREVMAACADRLNPAEVQKRKEELEAARRK